MQGQKSSWPFPPWLPSLGVITPLPELSRLEEVDQVRISNQTIRQQADAESEQT
jgi:hypothetical protein